MGKRTLRRSGIRPPPTQAGTPRFQNGARFPTPFPGVAAATTADTGGWAATKDRGPTAGGDRGIGTPDDGPPGHGIEESGRAPETHTGARPWIAPPEAKWKTGGAWRPGGPAWLHRGERRMRTSEALRDPEERKGLHAVEAFSLTGAAEPRIHARRRRSSASRPRPPSRAAPGSGTASRAMSLPPVKVDAVESAL